MLERFASRIVEVIQKQLNSEEPGVRWMAAMTEMLGDTVRVEVETTIGRDWAGTAISTTSE